jgi:uncharacterized membrane protein YeiH
VTWLYVVQMLGTAVFAATGVLVIRRERLDAFAALVLGLVTALGGGTARDTILRAPIFWIDDINYVWAAVAAALIAFYFRRWLRRTHELLLYLDAAGVALFAVAALEKTLVLGYNGTVAVIMAVLTSIGGGLMRDVLAGRPTLLMSREIYATPVLLGCTLFVLVRDFMPEYLTEVLALIAIFGVRALAIHRHLEMPLWLTRDGMQD